ncbi:hypothetical protein [Acidovorax sp. sic0104]|uniref:hypothetical protein n=1 Tax=Acidovorax sp. sic0104 TaxID=2854784 RepID=UPI001C468830|nr:hypothetical protein [Acidovorax sp. sic0104]MBV7541895.1 hypothetical protein [Acidovorax sp. sic0104]
MLIEDIMYNITALIKLSENIPRPHTGGGVKSGYAPHHKFSNIHGLVSGFHKYSDENYHFFGEELIAEIAFPGWENFCELVRIGDSFEIRELNTLVGYGKVLTVNG